MDLYAVWIRGESGWVLNGHVPKAAAEESAERYESMGVRCRICPRHRNTMSDLVEG